MPQALESPLEWPKQGNARVPYRVFADPEIYRTELGRVFLGPTWQYLALADELPEPGDYRTTFLGETPVIVTRGEDGAIHAMVNRCAHRGNLVCLKQRGHNMTGRPDTRRFGATVTKPVLATAAAAAMISTGST